MATPPSPSPLNTRGISMFCALFFSGQLMFAIEEARDPGKGKRNGSGYSKKMEKA